MEGRSLRRQVEAAKAYCKRHGLTLDEHSFADLGVSGYHGGNATHGELAEFLDLVKSGRVPKGSVLLVENIDRLSRLPPHEANAVLMQLVAAGVEIVTLSPEQRYTAENISKPGTWIQLQVAQALAYEESVKKGERLTDAWGAKRAEADTKKMTKKGPAWLKLTADRTGWIVLEPKAACVRRMFELALHGCGVTTIAGILDKEYPQGLSGRGWQPASIGAILRSPSVLGRYQPHVGTCAKKGQKATRRPHGEPIQGYFPAIIAEADFYRVQEALDGRRSGGGRITGTPNLFSGLAYDARDGKRLVLNATHGEKVLVSSGAVRKQAGSTFLSLRYDTFEQAILSRLAELSAADVLGKPDTEADQVAALSGRLTTVNAKLEAVRARAEAEDDVTVFLDLLADLDRQRREIIAELEKAKASAASRQGDNLGEFQSLAALLEDAATDKAERDELRRKTRAALRRLVKEMWVLIVPLTRGRLIAVQAWFASGAHRDYLIHQEGGTKRQHSGGWRCWSLADAVELGSLDLRKSAHASRLEAGLRRLPVESL
jgi:DNA invertase Pin-like site-specific DNA recombinase